VAVKAEIISVGTELLLGTITDTNATYLAQRLAALGIDLYHVSQVGDNLGRIVEVLMRASERSDLIITTGGLGPTQDDLTRESIGVLLGEEMAVSPQLETHLRSLYTRRGIAMPESNLKQACLIPSATALNNPVGTAPGWSVQFQLDDTTRRIVAMPGVPFEMKRMWEREVEPTLMGASGYVIVSRTLKTLGLGESRVEEMVADLMRSENPTLAPYAKSDGVHLRITAKASSRQEALERIDTLDRVLRERLGDAVYGEEGDTPPQVALAALNDLASPYLLLEVGRGAFGSLGTSIATSLLCVGCISIEELSGLAKMSIVSEVPDNLTEAADRLLSIAPLVVAVETRCLPLAEVGALTFTAEVVVAERGEGVPHARSRFEWRAPESEIPRLTSLAALNLVRKEAAARRHCREGSAVC
jgi:molybdenum cofactor synthesis domain-containing protein